MVDWSGVGFYVPMFHITQLERGCFISNKYLFWWCETNPQKRTFTNPLFMEFIGENAKLMDLFLGKTMDFRPRKWRNRDFRPSKKENHGCRARKIWALRIITNVDVSIKNDQTCGFRNPNVGNWLWLLSFSAPFFSCARLLGRDAQWHLAGALASGGASSPGWG